MKRLNKLLALFLSITLLISLDSVRFSTLALTSNEADDVAEDIFEPLQNNTDTFIDFENSDISALYGNDNVDNNKKILEVVDNPLKCEQNNSNKVLNAKPTAKASAANAGNNGVFLLSSNYIPNDSSLFSVNFKMLLECDDGEANFRYPTFVYDYTDEDNWRGIAIKSVRGKLTAVAVGMPCANSWSQPTYETGFLSSKDFVLANSDKTTALPFKTWISVSAIYSGSTVDITLATENGYMQLFNNKCKLSDTTTTRIGFTCMDRTFYIDDLDINFSGTSVELAAKSFLKKNAGIFKYRSSTLSTDDNNALIGAINDYNELPDAVKSSIPHSKVYLDELKKRMGEITGIDGYSHINERPSANYWDTHTTFTFTDNFDDPSSLSRYIDFSDAETWLGEPAIISSDNPLKDSALGVTDSSYTIREELLPEKAKLQLVEFDYTVQADTPVPFYADVNLGYASAVDKDNYFRLFLLNFPGEENANEFRHYRSTYSKNGALTSFGATGLLNSAVAPGTKLHISYIYGNDSMEVKIMSGEETIYEDELNFYDQRGKFVISGCNSRFKGWYDNLRITYVKGDWDVDEVSDDINVYYSGATMQKPGDVVLIHGDNIGNIVSGVEVMPLSEDISNRKYYDYQSFSEYGIENGKYSSDPTEVKWNSNISVKTEIVQKTAESVKFEIPVKDAAGNPMPEGIYAIKLTGEDSKTNYIEKIITINTPHIDYTVGDDGSRVSAGGYIEAVGKNLAFPTSNTETLKNYDNLKVLLVNKNGSVAKNLPIETVFSDYNLRVSVPLDTPDGDYELWLYSGYGWSAPSLVTITESVKTKLLNQQTITVTDNPYTGDLIEGDRAQNATYYVQELLDILGEQGGGVLYFPKGIYRFNQPLIIPKNVCIVGSNMVETIFLWTSFNWAYNNLPTYLLGAEGNSVIMNIDIYVHRTGGIISLFGDDVENIYLSNIRTYSQKLSGATTGGGHSGSWFTPAELILLNTMETKGWTISTLDRGKLVNFQMTNCDFHDYAGTGSGSQGMRLTYYSSKSSYCQIYDSKFNCGWSPGQCDNVIVRNFDFSEACFAITGRNVLYDNCYVHDNTTNNRELFVADLGPMATLFTGVYPDYTDPTGCTYFVPNTSHSADDLENAALYVMSNQGAGQSRIIVSCQPTETKGLYRMTFDSPFQVAPNRNSGCIIRRSRENMYFINNSYYNGSCVGFFGGVTGVVYDGNTYQRVGNQYLWAWGGDPNWYCSLNNEKTIYDPFFMTSVGTEADSGFTSFIVRCGNLKYLRAIVFRNCDFAGRRLTIMLNRNDSLVDLLVDKCAFSNSEMGIYSDCNVYGGAGMDGVLLYGLSFTNVDTPYARLSESINAKNSLNVARVKIMGDTYSDFLLGDVNLDGKISLKDCTMIKMYLAKMIELTDEQLARADRNQDGKVNLKDSTSILMLDILS